MLKLKKVMINHFRGEYNWLSNFADCKIKLRGIEYGSVETAYMSERSHSKEWKEFCRTHSASEVKKASKEIELRKDWEDVKLLVMKYCLIQKFNQEAFKSKLKATGNENIVEGNFWQDEFWGVNLKKNPNIGENHLGRLIMNIRKNL